jgi:hypothetical protein
MNAVSFLERAAVSFEMKDLMVFATPVDPEMSTSSNCCKCCSSSKTKKSGGKVSDDLLSHLKTQLNQALLTSASR